MSANTYGRQVIVPLTNKSGGSVAAGDVVVIDTTNNEAFTTSTAGAVTGGVGVAQETIASNAVGRVMLEGYAALVNVNASVTRGNFGKTYTVIKQATDAGASRTVGTFCQFLTGGTTPTARVYPPDVNAASGSVATDPIWTTAGQLAVATGSATASALAIGAVGSVLGRINGAVAWNGGTSMPGSKATGDRFWRSDLGLGFYWDGTRWLSDKLYTLDFPAYNDATSVQPISGSPIVVHRFVAMTDLYDMWVVDFRGTLRVQATNNGTNFWTVKVSSVGAAAADLGNFTSAADTANTITRHTTSIGALVGTTNTLLQTTATKTLTPGNLDLFTGQITYRLVGT